MSNVVISKYRQDVEFRHLSDASTVYWNDANKLIKLHEVVGNNFMQNTDAVSIFNGDYVNIAEQPTTYFIKQLMHAYINFDVYSCRTIFSRPIDESTRLRCVAHLSLKFYMLDLLVRYPMACRNFLQHKRQMCSYIDSLHYVFAQNVPVYDAEQQYAEMQHIIGYCIDKHRILLDCFALPYKDVDLTILNRPEEQPMDELLGIRSGLTSDAIPVAINRYLKLPVSNRDALMSMAAKNNLSLFISTIPIKAYTDTLARGYTKEILDLDPIAIAEGIICDYYKFENLFALKFSKANSARDRSNITISGLILKFALLDFLCSCYPATRFVLSEQSVVAERAEFEFHSYRSNKLIMNSCDLVNEISVLLRQLISYHCGVRDAVGLRYFE